MAVAAGAVGESRRFLHGITCRPGMPRYRPEICTIGLVFSNRVVFNLFYFFKNLSLWWKHEVRQPTPNGKACGEAVCSMVERTGNSVILLFCFCSRLIPCRLNF